MTTISPFTGKPISEDNMFFSQSTGLPTKDNEFYEAAKSQNQAERDATTTAAEQITEGVAKEGDWTDSDRSMLSMFITDSLGTIPFVGTGVELGTHAAAGAYWLLNPEIRDTKSPRDIYDEMMTSAEAEMAAFAEQKPIAAGVGSFAGAVMNPTALATGQVLGAAANIRSAQKAREAQQAASSVIIGKEAAEQAAIQSRQLAQQYSKAPSAAFNIASDVKAPVVASALVAGEGAALAYTQGGDVGQAAIIGAAVPFGFAALGGAANQLTKQRVYTEMGEGEDFIPLMYTESGAANLYRTVVGKAFGAQTLTQQQILSFTRRFPALNVLKDNGKTFINNTKVALNRAKAAISGDKDRAITIAKQHQDERLLELENSKIIEKSQVQQAKVQLEDHLGGLTEDEIKDAAVREADAAVNALQASFRALTIRSAAPAGVSDDVLNDLDLSDPRSALLILDDQWSKLGFQAAKSKVFSIDVNRVSKDMESLLDGNPEAVLALKQSGNLKAAVEFVSSVLEASAKGGKISGDDLVQLRSRVGTLINSLSEGSGTALVRKYVNDIQDYFDDIIIKQLSPEEAASFAADKAAWLNKRLVEDSVLKATGRSKASQGSYTADDWIEASKSATKRSTTRGQAPLQAQAEEVSNLAAERSSIIKQNASSQIKQAKELAQRQLQTEANAAKKAKVDIQLETNKAKKAAREEYDKSAKTATDKANLETKLAEFEADMSTRMADYDSQIKELSGKLDWLAENSTRDNVSLFEQLFSTTILAAPVSALATGVVGPAGILVGTGTARALSTEAAQKAFAGQTKAQRMANAFLQNMSMAMRKTAADKGIDVRSSTVAAGESQPDRPIISSDVAKSIMRTSDKNKAAAFAGLLSRNQADKLKNQNPTLYKELKRAYDSQQ